MNRQDESMSYDMLAEYSARMRAMDYEVRALTNDLARLEREAARYRAALEEISNHRGTPTAGGYSVCDWCGVSVDAHRSDCAAVIAHRALHPEEGER